VLLDTILFDFTFVHPQKYIIKFARVLGMDKIAARRAWSVLMVSPLTRLIYKDSYYCPVSASYTPQELALASLFSAQAFIDQKNGKPVDVEAVKAVCGKFHCEFANVMSM
jgi:hypothetical protein